MKTLLFIILMLLTISAHAMPTGDGWIGVNPSLPSCSLYRHRLADYFQRNQEVNLALKIKKARFTNEELKNLQILWNRTDIPLLQNESVIWKMEMDLASTPFKKEDVARVSVQSEVFEWDNNRFEFPEEVLRFSVIKNKQMVVSFEMPYMQSCLVVKNLNIEFELKNGKIRKWQFEIER